LYAQTQATPYAATIDPALRDADGAYFDFSDTNLIDTFDPSVVFQHKGSWVPGTVMLNRGEVCLPSVGSGSEDERAFGLLANFVGGQLDDLGDENYIGVWRGPDSVYELLKPGFNPGEGNAKDILAAFEASKSGNPVRLHASDDGRLGVLTTPGDAVVVAHLLEAFKNRIVIDLKV